MTIKPRSPGHKTEHWVGPLSVSDLADFADLVQQHWGGVRAELAGVETDDPAEVRALLESGERSNPTVASVPFDVRLVVTSEGLLSHRWTLFGFDTEHWPTGFDTACRFLDGRRLLRRPGRIDRFCESSDNLVAVGLAMAATLAALRFFVDGTGWLTAATAVIFGVAANVAVWARGPRSARIVDTYPPQRKGWWGANRSQFLLGVAASVVAAALVAVVVAVWKAVD